MQCICKLFLWMTDTQQSVTMKNKSKHLNNVASVLDSKCHQYYFFIDVKHTVPKKSSNFTLFWEISLFTITARKIYNIIRATVQQSEFNLNFNHMISTLPHSMFTEGCMFHEEHLPQMQVCSNVLCFSAFLCVLGRDTSICMSSERVMNS